MSNAIPFQTACGVTPTLVRKLSAFELALRQAIDEAKAADIPQGLIVATLVGHTHLQTVQMCSGS